MAITIIICVLFGFLTNCLLHACSVFPEFSCCSSTTPFSDKLASISTIDDLLSLTSTDSVKAYANMDQVGTGDKHRPKNLRILCFGDSLTSGYMSSDSHSHPYGDTMQNELAHMLSSTPAKINTTIDGKPGRFSLRHANSATSPENLADR